MEIIPALVKWGSFRFAQILRPLFCETLLILRTEVGQLSPIFFRISEMKLTQQEMKCKMWLLSGMSCQRSRTPSVLRYKKYWPRFNLQGKRATANRMHTETASLHLWRCPYCPHPRAQSPLLRSGMINIHVVTLSLWPGPWPDCAW